MVYFCVASTKIYLYLWLSEKLVAKQLICGTVYKYDRPPATEFVVVVVKKANKGCRFRPCGSHERREHWCLVWRHSRHHMVGESVHLRRFHSDEVMVVFLIAECASKTHSKFNSTMNRNCYDWLKNILVFEVVTGRLEVVSTLRSSLRWGRRFRNFGFSIWTYCTVLCRILVARKIRISNTSHESFISHS